MCRLKGQRLEEGGGDGGRCGGYTQECGGILVCGETWSAVGVTVSL